MASYQSISLADIEARLLERVGGNAAFWTPEEFRDAFNEGLQVWQATVGEWTRKVDRPVISGNFYEVPHQVVSVNRLSWNGAPLTGSALPEADHGFIGWEDSTSTTPLYWAPSGLNEVAIWPAPTSGSLTFDGIMETPRLLLAGDKLDIGDEEFTRLLDYAHHILTFKEGGSEFEASKPLMVNFLEAVGLRNSRFTATSQYVKWMGIDRAEGERRPRTHPEIGARI